MVNDYEGNLNDNGWKLAQDWKLDDLEFHPEEHDRQDRFATDVHAFLNAGDPGGAPGSKPETPANGISGASGGTAFGLTGQEPKPFDAGLAHGLQTFVKAGLDMGGAFGSVPVNFTPEKNNSSQIAPLAVGNIQNQGSEVKEDTPALSGRRANDVNGNVSGQTGTSGRYNLDAGYNQDQDPLKRFRGEHARVAWNYATEYGTSGDGLQPGMRNVEGAADTVFNRIAGRDATVTYTTNGTHSPNSQHYSGNAVDLRTRDMTPEQIHPATEQLRNELGAGYRVINEGDHIHIQVERARG